MQNTDITTRWGSLPMSDWLGLTSETAHSALPVFKRANPEQFGLGANPHLDLLVRSKGPETPYPVPVALVSKTYRLLQHGEILDRVCAYAKKIGDSKLGEIQVSMSPNGERLMMRIGLGEDWSLSPDGQLVGLQIICHNSVDGSSALRLRLGWFRYVCSNGMVVGVTRGKARMAHKASADLDGAFNILKPQLKVAKQEKLNLDIWATQKISQLAIQAWADQTVAGKWNSLSAARVWHICRSGNDVKFVPPFEKSPPTRRKIKELGRVPGAPEEAKTIYDVAQALSWVASRKSDVDEAETHQRSIGRLLRELQKA